MTMVKPDLILQDLRVALRSLWRTKGLAITVILTLALGIGANAAIFSLVRGVLLRPLVNRDENRLIYIRQSAPGLQLENANFSVPEIQDLKGGVKTIRRVRRLLRNRLHHGGTGRAARGARRSSWRLVFRGHGAASGAGQAARRSTTMVPNAAGACVLTYRFWKNSLKGDPTVIGKTVRLGDRTATIVGVLEPSVPYPAETEIIANVVTSPHHLSATMVTGRVHRMTELFGRLAPGATLEQANAELQHGLRVDGEGASRSLRAERTESNPCRAAARPDHVGREDGAAGAAGRIGADLYHCVLERRQSDSGALGAPRRRTGDSRRAGSEHRRVAAHAAGGEPVAVRRPARCWAC